MLDGEGNTPFALAAASGVPGVVELLYARIDPENRQAQGCQAMAMAVRHGHAVILKFLLQQFSNILKMGNMNELFVLACANGFIDVMQTLHESSQVDINAVDKGCKNLTGLHYAAGQGKPEALHWLSEHKVNFQVRDSNGATALHLAMGAAIFKSEIAALLMAKIDCNGTDAQGNTPTHYAISAQSVEAVKFLLKQLESGVKINLLKKNKLGCMPLEGSLGFLHKDTILALYDCKEEQRVNNKKKRKKKKGHKAQSVTVTPVGVAASVPVNPSPPLTDSVVVNKEKEEKLAQLKKQREKERLAYYESEPEEDEQPEEKSADAADSQPPITVHLPAPPDAHHDIPEIPEEGFQRVLGRREKQKLAKEQKQRVSREQPLKVSQQKVDNRKPALPLPLGSSGKTASSSSVDADTSQPPLAPKPESEQQSAIAPVINPSADMQPPKTLESVLQENERLKKEAKQAGASLLFFQAALKVAHEQTQSVVQQQAQQPSNEQAAQIAQLTQQLAESQAESKVLRNQLDQSQTTIEQILDNHRFDKVAGAKKVERLEQEINRLKFLLGSLGPAPAPTPAPTSARSAPPSWQPRFPYAGAGRAESFPPRPASGKTPRKK